MQDGKATFWRMPSGFGGANLPGRRDNPRPDVDVIEAMARLMAALSENVRLRLLISLAEGE